LQFVQLRFQCLFPGAELVDPGVQLLDVARRRLRQFPVFGVHLALVRAHRVEAILLGFQLVADVVEFRAPLLQCLQSVFEFGLFFTALFDVGVRGLDLGLDVRQFRRLLLDPVL